MRDLTLPEGVDGARRRGRDGVRLHGAGRGDRRAPVLVEGAAPEAAAEPELIRKAKAEEEEEEAK